MGSAKGGLFFIGANMAFSTQRATSTGTLSYLALSIDYLDRSDITVFLNDLPATENVDWEWDGTNSAIRFIEDGVETPLGAGVEVLVARNTALDQNLHVFSAQAGGGGSAKFVNLTVDENFRQLLLIAQESKEGSNLGDVYQNLNMHGFRPVNVGPGDPNELGDIPNMGQLFTLSGAAGTSANQAAASASTAATAANTASTAAGTASSAASTAQLAAGQAAASAASAATSAGTATLARNDAIAASGAAASARDGAEDARDLAEDWANKTDGPVDGFEFSAKYYAIQSLSGVGLPVRNTVPTMDVGPVYVVGVGAMEWNYVVSAYVPTTSAGATGGGSDQVFFLNDQVITADYTVPSDKNAHTTGPIEVAPGVTVEIAPGATFKVI